MIWIFSPRLQKPRIWFPFVVSLTWSCFPANTIGCVWWWEGSEGSHPCNWPGHHPVGGWNYCGAVGNSLHYVFLVKLIPERWKEAPDECHVSMIPVLVFHGNTTCWLKTSLPDINACMCTGSGVFLCALDETVGCEPAEFWESSRGRLWC